MRTPTTCISRTATIPTPTRPRWRPIFVATGPSNTKGIEAEGNVCARLRLQPVRQRRRSGSAKYQTGPNYPNGGQWVANTPSNIEGVNLLWQHQNWDVGLIYKRVGQYYNDNGTLTYTIDGVKIPYPVDQAITIIPGIW